MKEIRIAKLKEDAIIPSRKHETDAGLDLYVYSVPGGSVEKHSYNIISTGISIEIPEGYVGLIWPKGKSNHLIGAGVVDAGYQGEILIKVFNPTNQRLYFKIGDPIAQLLIQPVFTPIVKVVSKSKLFKEKSERGETGGIVDQNSVTLEVQDGVLGSSTNLGKNRTTITGNIEKIE